MDLHICYKIEDEIIQRMISSQMCARGTSQQSSRQRILVSSDLIWIHRRSSSHHSKKIPQAIRNMKNSTLEGPLIHLSIWRRNDAIMNEEDDETEGSRRSLLMKQLKISIQLSFHDIVWLCICLYSVDVLFMFLCLHLYYCIAHDG